MRILTLTFCVLALFGFADAKPKKDQPFIFLNPNDTLHIQVIDSVGYHNVGRNDRFRRFRETLEAVFEEMRFPMEYKIERMMGGKRIPPNQPRLDLTIIRWGDDGMSEIEVRLSASLRYEFDRNKLGTFYFRGGTQIGTSEMLTRIYNDVLREALLKMVTELHQRFPIAYLEEAEIDAEGGIDIDLGEQPEGGEN